MQTIQLLLKNLFWRFLLLFILFYIVPYDLGYSITDKASELTIWDTPIMWIGETFYNWEFQLDRLYKGYDSKFEFCRYIFVFFVATIGTLLWLLIDKFLQKEYTNKLKIITQTILRYHLGLTLINYGLAKIFMLQFGTIGIDTMEQTIGGLTGMTFMSHFYSYSQIVIPFSGWLEFIGGILLLFRRTTFLGAILLIIVMGNVVLMNWDFGFTVTMYATLLFCLLLMLISTQLKSLLNYVVLNKTTQSEAYKPLVNSKKIRIIFKVALISLVGYFYIQEYSDKITEYKTNRYAWFTNLQTVETFVVNNDTLASTTSKNKSEAWKKITFNGFSSYPESFEVITEKGSYERFKFEIDSTTKIIRYRPFFDKTQDWSELKYKKTDKRKYTFEGIYKKDTISVTTKAKYLNDYILMYYRGKLLFDDY
ncbi:DoxX family protein [Kordia sp.]|uniref:DoxX family protein n=1 Tax=Kordia sp. TaxID=1965332 RepID=UPI003B594530